MKKVFNFKLVLSLMFSILLNNVVAQNIFSGEPVQVVGQMNGYSTASGSNTTYRKISTTTNNPTDGRGQWVKTYNVQNSGGDFSPINMAGGASNGLLFISGPAGNRFQNKWAFSNLGTTTINGLNTISYSNTGAGVDMGLNMNSPGRYTFVFNDAGYTSTNAKFCVSYTAAAPITLTKSSQTINTDRTTTIGITTSASPSAGENIYVRYTTAYDFSTSNSSGIVQATGIGTNWTATIPAQASGSVVKYYVFSSTVSSIASLSEVDKSLAAINFDDNGGVNYSYILTKGISRFTTSTPVICGTSTVYTINIVGSDIFSAPYQWQFINSNDSINGIPNAGITSQTLGNQTQSIQYKYWRRISQFGTPNADTSNWVLVTMNPLPTANISGTTAVCKNATAPNITFTGASGTAPYTFTYNINGGSNTTVSTTIGNSVTVAASTANAGTFTYNLVSVQNTDISSCTQAQSGSATITVNPLPTASISGTTSVCKNASSPNITFTGASGTAPYTFTYNINGGSNTTVSTTSGNSVTVAASTANAGTFTYNLVSVQDASSTSCSQAQSGSATITVNPLPTVSISGTTTKCKNSSSPNITFTGASGTAPYSFTYNINGGSNTTVSTTSGNSVTVAASTANTGTFTFNLVSAQDASSTSCSQSQSGSATITVNPLPTASISGTTAVCKNASSPNITFTGASGTAPYTFAYNINGGANTTVSTTSGNSVTVATSTANAGTFTYNLVSVQDASSTACSQTQSGSATITVSPLPTASISGTITVCKSSSSPNITFTGASGTAPYTFTYNINGGTNTTVSTTSGNSVTVAASTANAGTFTYNLVSVQDASSTSCSQSQSGSAIVTINPIPVYNGTTAQTICSGATTNINLTANTSGGTNSFSWVSSSVSGITGNGNASGSTLAQTLNTSNTIATNVGYLVTPTFIFNSVGCLGAAAPITIIVNPKPQVNSSTSQTICSGLSNTVNLTSNTSGGSNTFVWSTIGNSNLTGFNVSGSTSQIGSHTISNAATMPQNLLYIITPSFTNNSVSCAGSSANYTYTINPIPSVTSPTSQTVCSGVSSSVALTANTSGGSNSFIWSTAGNSSLSGFNTSGSASTIGSHTIISASVAPTSLAYNIIPTYTNNSVSCTGLAASLNYTINPIPSLNSLSSQTVCSGVKSSVNLTSNTISGTNTFNWSTLGNSNLSGFNTSGATSTIDSQTIVNSATTPQTLVYSITPIFTNNSVSCVGTSTNFTYIINPKPVVTNYVSTDICSGASTNLTLTSNIPSTFSWTLGIIQNNGPVIGASVGSGTSINQTLTNPSDSNTVSVLYIVTPTSSVNSCVGNPKSIFAHVYPIPVVTNSNALSICSGTSPNLTLTASTPSSFAWTLGQISNTISGASVNNGSEITQILSNSSNSNAGKVTYNITPTSTANYCVGKPYPVEIIVNPIPQYNGDRTQKICSGNSTNLLLSSTTTGGLNSFTYTSAIVNGVTGNLSDSSTNSISQNLVSNNSLPTWVKYYVTPKFILNSLSCNGNSVTDSVLVNPSPKVSFTIDEPTKCLAFNSFTFTNTTPATFSRIWNSGDLHTNTNDTFIQSYTNAGSYLVTLKVTNANNCSDSASKTITIKPSPIKPVVSAISNSQLKCTSANSYQWFKDLNLLNGETNQVLNLTSNGNYSVYVDSTNGCWNVSNDFVASNVGTKELNNINLIELYPNPNNGEFKLKITSTKASETRISLLNMLGQEVWNDNKTLSAGAQEIDLTTNVAAGVYVLRLNNEDGQVQRSVVVR